MALKDIIDVIDKIKKMASPHIGLWDDPWRILITGILSTRTKDETTDRASMRLFCKFSNPIELSRADEKEVESLIKPVGFYRQKAKNVIRASRMIVEDFGNEIPDKMEELLKIPGVGRKVANIVISYGFKGYGLAVDTHVFRVFNRIGVVRAKNPEEMEFKLKSKLPQDRWNEVNSYLVEFGKNICKPLKPRCEICLLRIECDYFRGREK